MRDSGRNSYFEHLLDEFSCPNQEQSPCHGIENVSIIVNKKWKKCKKHKVFEHAQQPPIAFCLSRYSKPNKELLITRHSSMPELSKCTRTVPGNRGGHGTDYKKNNYNLNPFRSKFIANVFSEHRFDNWFLNPNYPSQTKWKIYRCQLGVVEDSCCCNCNSDAMFEVMKGLYDCYKAKNCDGCDCVLCGYKTKEERKLGELRKSMTSVAREKVLEGKTPAEKEFILKEMARTGQALPSGKTASEKALIDKTRKELGLPPPPKSASQKVKMRKALDAGIITPLEGKTLEEKEKILRAQADMGLHLPEGRTASEKALIEKIKALKKPSLKSALLTTLTGKTPDEKEKILRDRAIKGLPLPQGRSASEKKIIDKVRADVGLPKEPTTKSLRDKFEQAAKAGLLQPLEGKTPEEKEKTLKGLQDLGIPLPEGRTPSEKALIAKVKSAAKTGSIKTAGLMTPLTGKPPEQKEKILRARAMKGIPLPEGQTPSEKKIIDKVRADLGLPKEPTTKSLKDKFEQAAKAGLLQPLEGKTPEEKEKILKGQHDLGISLPEGRTPSEKALIAKIKATTRAGSIKTAGLMTPLLGKSPAHKEKVLRARAMKGIPLPEGQTPSEKKIIDKVRADLGLPQEPTTKSLKDKFEQAAKAGLLQPLEGKTPEEKEKILKGQHDLGISLPEGRTPSEKALIAKIKATAPAGSIKTAGLMTPLLGKSPAHKEKVLRARAMKGIPLPEGQTPSEKKIIDKVRADLGLPQEPTTKSLKDKFEQAAKAGLLQPLEGKTPEEKEKILKGQHDLGISLPEGRTPSEKALIAKIKAATPAGSIKTAGIMTPLMGKSPAFKEKVLRARAMKGIPLPEGQTPSEKKIIDKVRADLGLPQEPTTKSLKDKFEQAAKAGLLQPLEGKTPEEKEKTLKGLQDLGIPLPEGRTPSEKALIAKVKSAAKPASIKTAGLMTPLTGKTPEQKEKVLRARAMKGIPLPEGQTPSEKKIIDKVRADLGLPKEPTTKSLKDKFEQAAKAGLLQPLEGKTPEEKEKTLKGLQDLGIPLPEGRTPSEKALIAKVKSAAKTASIKTAGLMTPLTGKTPEQKEKVLRARAMKGIPLPEGQTPSEKKIIDKVRTDLGLPKEPTTKSLKDKFEQAAKAGLLQPLEGKTLEEKEKTLKGLQDLGIPLPEGRTPSEKALIAKVKSAAKTASIKTAGLMTPLTGKTPEQKEKVLRARAMKGIPLPEGQTPSEKKIIDKVRADLGLPKEPTTKSLKDKFEQAAKAGLLQPLEGKTPEEKEKILKGQHDLGISLPEGRTPSEKALIAKIKAMTPAGSIKTAGIMTPLLGKSPAFKEKVLRARAMKGIPLPEGQTPSDKKIIDKVRADLGLPQEPTTKSLKDKFEQAAKAGLLQPLEGKTPEEKEKILKGQHDLGISLPEGRTPSEKALIAKIKAATPAGSIKTAGLMTPLLGKSPAHKEKVLRARAMKGIPLPEGQTPSEKKVIDKVRADLGLPKEPETKSMRDKYEQAAKAGLLQPLEGKVPEEKEKILKGLQDLGIPLPEGRTPSEKALIAKVKSAARLASIKTAGLMTLLTGKPPEHKEKILRARAMKGIPLPEGQTPSEKKMIDKVRVDLGLPKEPETKSMKDKYEQAAKAGLLQPLMGKTPEEKEKILQGQHDLGIPLPEGRTPSEKALIAKIKTMPRAGSIKTAGIMTPLTGKSPALKEKVLRARAMKGIPLPEGQTPSEKIMIDKVRADLGLPKEPTTKSLRDKHEQAAKAGLLEPLEGKTPAQKEAILKGLRDMGIPLPEGRTPSEKALIAKVKGAARSVVAPSEQMRRAKAEGLMTPLTGKTPAQKEKILKGLAMKGLRLPEGKSPSEKKLIDKVRVDLGLPKEPETKSMKDKYEQAAKAGLLQPLMGKTPEEKEKILQGQHDLGIPLPEGRTPSEKALIAKIKATPRAGSIKTAGLMTPLTGKSPALKEKVLRARAMKGIPLPEGQTPSEKIMIDKVRADLGLPKEPTTKSLRDKHEQAAKAGLLEPLEGKTPAQKEAILKGLRDMGIPLPEGRTPSEKALIAKVKSAARSVVAPSEQMRRAKAEGLMTPLTGKTPAQKEKILKGLAMKGLPLPEGKSPSEKKLIDKVRVDLGLPKEPETKSMKDKYEQAAKAGLLQPLMGKTPEEKEKILQGQHDLGMPLPEGRTPSEKALIAKIKATPPAGSIKTAGLMTPLMGKSSAHKEKILRARAMKGIPLPEGQTPSEKKMIDKVRADLGLPKEPTTKSLRDKHEQAAKAGLLEPLEGKTPAQKEAQLKGLRDMGIPLPEGRTPSEKALIAKVKGGARSFVAPSEQMRRAKAEGLMTPLSGKTPAQKEKILKGLAMKGLPLPEGKSPSEKKLIDKVREDLGLPKEPETKSMKDKYDQAAKVGLLQPLLGKTPEEKEKILQGQHDLGIPLPEGRTPSEKALIAKIKATPPVGSIKTAGIMTPLAGKSPALKEKVLRARAMKGIPLPEGQTPSEKKIIDKVRADLGLPKEPTTKSLRDKHEQAAKAGLLEPLEGKTPAQKEAQLKGLRDMGIPLPEGRTPSEKALIAKVKGAPRSVVAPSEQMRRAKAEGLMTPLTGKTPAQKEKILKGLAMKGLPLPEGKSPSEKKLIDKVREDLGLPKEPETKSLKDKYEQAAKAGLLQPLMGKTPEEKEKILKGLQDMGIPLPEGRTPSEKALIAKVKSAARLASIKTAGLMTPLTGKTPEQKEKIVRARAMKGLPLPEGQTPSEKKMIDKVRADLGLPKEPTTKSLKDKFEEAAKAGLLQPLEGKTPEEKEKILQGQHDLGIPLPEGRTPSEKALIAKIKASPPVGSIKTAGIMTPLAGKSAAHKEKVLRARAMKGIPLPEGQTPSEKQMIDKVRADLGLPKEPTTKSLRDKHEQAAKAGLLEPLEGKTPAQKEAQLKGLRDMGIPLPEGRTPSEKALIAKVKGAPRSVVAPSEQMRRAKAEGLMTPLTGKSPAQKEKILKGLAMKGLPLPEGKSPSEKKLIDKVREDLGLPNEPDTKSMKDKYEQAAKAGLLQPLMGKTPEEKEKILQGQHDLGIPLPEGRTPSEKALIAKVKAGPRAISAALSPSEQMRRAKMEGLLTPLKGKTPDQKEKILKGLAMKGLDLPEPQTPSEKKLVDKVRADLGLPREPTTKSLRDKFDQAAKSGLLQPLEGKTPEEKEKTLKGLQDMGIPLPEGRTPSEKALIAKVKASTKKAASVPTITTEKIQKAKAAGFLTPLAGKTPEQKEKILKGLAQTGLPLPEGKTPSEKALIDKVKKELGIPEKTPSEKMRRAKVAGLFTPLEGKTAAQKEKILRGRVAAGMPLPTGKTPSEKALIKKIKDETGYVTPSPSDRMRKAKDAGFLTPLKGKSPSMKAKILQGMKAAGIPIPEGETPSEKKIISKLISKPEIELEGIPSDKIKAAKAAGLLTPLEGKTPAQKEKIIKGLAEAGLPLPEGKTKSEKSMIAKVKARLVPEGQTPSEKSIIGKAKAAGLFTPITGKAPAEKERILKGLVDAGLPLPEGKTASEKEMVKKIRAEAGLAPEPTPSEKKGKIRKKAKKVGVSASKRAAGIDAEEFEDIIKTTKCDRGCGCDRKKIRFKHSYVKIRVTSPDISSFCDCPYECLPGVKAGAFIDNEGIKVTVGSAVGIPSYSMVCINQGRDATISNTEISETQPNYYNSINSFQSSKYNLCKFESDLQNNSITAKYFLNVSSSNTNCSIKPYHTQSKNSYVHSNISHYQDSSTSVRIVESLEDLKLLEDMYNEPTSNTKSIRSFDTILIIRNDMSLSTSTSNSMDTISLTSVMDSSITTSSAHYSGYQSTNDLPSMNSFDGPTTSEDFIDLNSIRECNAFRNITPETPQKYTILRMSHLEENFGQKKARKSVRVPETDEPIVIFNNLPNKLDVSKIMFKLMSKKSFADASSIFIVVPTSNDEEEQVSTGCAGSITSVQSSECHFTANTTCIVDADLALTPPLFNQRGEQVYRKGRRFYLQKISSSNCKKTMLLSECVKALRGNEMMKDESCEINRPSEIAERFEKAVKDVGTNTGSANMTWCNFKHHYAADGIHKQIPPLFLKDFLRQLSWTRLPRPHKNSVPSIPTCGVSQDSSPVQLEQPPHHNLNQKTQTCASPTVCVSPCVELEVKRKRTAKVQKPSIESLYHEGQTVHKITGTSLIWSGIINMRKTLPFKTTCGVSHYIDSSISPLPHDRSLHYRHNQECTSHSEELRGKRTRSAKVQKPSLESLYHQDESAANITGVALSWSRIQRKRKTSGTQTPESRGGCTSYDWKVMRDLLKVQKPNIETIRRTAHKKSGLGSGWFHLPDTRKASVMHSKTKLKLTLVTLSHMKPELVSQCMSGQMMQHQEMFAIEQKAIREICLPIRKRTLMQEITKDTAKPPEPDQQTKLANDTKFVQQNLASIKTAKPMRAKVIMLTKFEDPEDQKNLKTKIVNQDENLKQPNKGKVPDSKQEASVQTSFRQLLEFQKKPLTKRKDSDYDKMIDPYLSKEIVIPPKPIDQQSMKLENETKPVQEKLASIQTDKHTLDKKNKPIEFTSSKDPKSPKIFENKEDTQIKPNTVSLYDSKHEIAVQPSFEPIPKLQEKPLMKQKHSLIICRPCPVHDKMLHSKLSKDKVKWFEPIDQQLAKEITPIKQKLANIKTVENPKSYNELESLTNIESTQANGGSKDLKTDSELVPGSKLTFGQPQQMSSNKQKMPREICGPFRKPMLKPEKEIVKQLEPIDQQPTELIKELTAIQQKTKAEAEEKRKIDKKISAKEMKSQKTSTKITKLCAEIRKTIFHKMNETLNGLMESNPNTSKQKARKVVCECKQDKLMSPKDKGSRTPNKLKEKLVTEQLPMPRQKRYPPQLPPALIGLPPLGTPEDLYEGIGPSCKWLDTGEIMRLRSELTHLTSGFKACKRKKLQKTQDAELEHDIELDFEDAIKYFASMNPKRFQQLMQEELESQLMAEEYKRYEDKKFKEKIDKARKKARKEAKKVKKTKVQ